MHTYLNHNISFFSDSAFKLCRGKNQRGKATCDGSSWANEMDNNQPSGLLEDAGDLNDLSGSCKVGESEQEPVLSLQDRLKWSEQHMVKVE